MTRASPIENCPEQGYPSGWPVAARAGCGPNQPIEAHSPGGPFVVPGVVDDVLCLIIEVRGCNLA
jgi:hypothetical protein